MNAFEFLNKVPDEWQAIIDAMPIGDRGELAYRLERICINAAAAAGYVEERFGSGSGDQGHKDAVKESHKFRDRVRKVLGI